MKNLKKFGELMVELDWRIGLTQAIYTGVIIGIGAGLLSYVDFRHGSIMAATTIMGQYGDYIMPNIKTE